MVYYFWRAHMINLPEFHKYFKIPRIENETFTISEKIDGSNGLIYVHHARFDDVKKGVDRSYILAGSRSKWLIDDGSKTWDNHGFGSWVEENEEDLYSLDEGYHYGEWYGKGINRGYGLLDKRFMLFNYGRYAEKLRLADSGLLFNMPTKVQVETVFHHNVKFEQLFQIIAEVRYHLTHDGSKHVQGYIKPEGLIVRSELSGKLWKVIIDK